MKKVYAFQIEKLVSKGIEVSVLDMANREIFKANYAMYSKVLKVINDDDKNYFTWTDTDYEELE